MGNRSEGTHLRGESPLQALKVAPVTVRGIRTQTHPTPLAAQDLGLSGPRARSAWSVDSAIPTQLAPEEWAFLITPHGNPRQPPSLLGAQDAAPCGQHLTGPSQVHTARGAGTVFRFDRGKPRDASHQCGAQSQQPWLSCPRGAWLPGSPGSTLTQTLLLPSPFSALRSPWPCRPPALWPSPRSALWRTLLLPEPQTPRGEAWSGHLNARPALTLRLNASSH